MFDVKVAPPVSSKSGIGPLTSQFPEPATPPVKQRNEEAPPSPKIYSVLVVGVTFDVQNASVKSPVMSVFHPVFITFVAEDCPVPMRPLVLIIPPEPIVKQIGRASCRERV